MLIYKDRFTNQELFIDSFKYTLQDDFVYIVEGRMDLVEDYVSDAQIGGNRSAEVPDEEEDATREQIEKINVVHACKLEEAYPIGKPDDYLDHMKRYSKKLLDGIIGLEQEAKTKLQEKLTQHVKRIMQDFHRFKFFRSEGDSDFDGMCVPVEEVDGKYLLYVIKEGVLTEKM